MLWAKLLQNDVPISTEPSPQLEISQNTIWPSMLSTSRLIYWRSGEGGIVCVECVSKGSMVILGLDKLTIPESIKSCITWWKVTQHPVSCLWVWWYKQCSCKRKWGGIVCGKGRAAKGTIKLTYLRFSKTLVKVMPNGVNCLMGLCAYGLGRRGVVAFRYGNCGCMLVWAMYGCWA